MYRNFISFEELNESRPSDEVQVTKLKVIPLNYKQEFMNFKPTKKEKYKVNFLGDVIFFAKQGLFIIAEELLEKQSRRMKLMLKSFARQTKQGGVECIQKEFDNLDDLKSHMESDTYLKAYNDKDYTELKKHISGIQSDDARIVYKKTEITLVPRSFTDIKNNSMIMKYDYQGDSNYLRSKVFNTEDMSESNAQYVESFIMYLLYHMNREAYKEVKKRDEMTICDLTTMQERKSKMKLLFEMFETEASCEYFEMLPDATLHDVQDKLKNLHSQRIILNVPNCNEKKIVALIDSLKDQVNEAWIVLPHAQFDVFPEVPTNLRIRCLDFRTPILNVQIPPFNVSMGLRQAMKVDIVFSILCCYTNILMIFT